MATVVVASRSPPSPPSLSSPPLHAAAGAVATTASTATIHRVRPSMADTVPTARPAGLAGGGGAVARHHRRRREVIASPCRPRRTSPQVVGSVGTALQARNHPFGWRDRYHDRPPSSLSERRRRDGRRGRRGHVAGDGGGRPAVVGRAGRVGTRRQQQLGHSRALAGGGLVQRGEPAGLGGVDVGAGRHGQGHPVSVVLAAAAWRAAMPMGCAAVAGTSAPARMSKAAAAGLSKNRASCTEEPVGRGLVDIGVAGGQQVADPGHVAHRRRLGQRQGRRARMASTTSPIPRYRASSRALTPASSVAAAAAGSASVAASAAPRRRP